MKTLSEGSLDFFLEVIEMAFIVVGEPRQVSQSRIREMNLMD